MTSQNIIFYPPGCYGTFFEWICNFLENSNIELPFLATGSSHGFPGNYYEPACKIFENIQSGKQFRFSRIHPGFFEGANSHERCFQLGYAGMLQEDLSFLKNHFDNILVLAYDSQSTLWQENNILTKTLLTEESYASKMVPYGYSREFVHYRMIKDPVLRIRYQLEHEINSVSPASFTVENLKGWGKTNIHDFEIWELRELLSFYWFTRAESQIAAWEKIKQSNHDLMHVSITALKTNFLDTILSIANYFDLEVNDSHVDRIREFYPQWLELQTQINKDDLCDTIVKSLCNNQWVDWSSTPLSIIDEAMIQKKLFENKIGIKCTNLNVFPTNTDDFRPLLENIQ
jgi:hypothetical protein